MTGLGSQTAHGMHVHTHVHAHECICVDQSRKGASPDANDESDQVQGIWIDHALCLPVTVDG